MRELKKAVKKYCDAYHLMKSYPNSSKQDELKANFKEASKNLQRQYRILDKIITEHEKLFEFADCLPICIDEILE